MKKKIILTLTTLGLLAAAGCGNKDILDTVRTYHVAIVEMPGGEVKEIKIKQWKDYEGDQIQIIEEGTGDVYLVHSTDCVLIRK